MDMHVSLFFSVRFHQCSREIMSKLVSRDRTVRELSVLHRLPINTYYTYFVRTALDI